MNTFKRIIFFVFSFFILFLPCFPSDWTEGSLFLKNGDTLSVPLKYSLSHSVVYSRKDDGKLKPWSCNKITGFELLDDEGKVFRRCDILYYQSPNGTKEPAIFELLYLGTKYSLYRTNLYLVPESASLYDEFGLIGERKELCAVNTSQEVIWFMLHKNHVLKLFSDKEKEVKNYVKEEKLRYLYLEDIISIFKFYNSL